MFWGVTLESGKRYSQKVAESYHLSMASLEPLHGGIRPANKEVSVMLEHGESEYVLCTLEYGRVMQVNLDIVFDIGEIVTYFLNGEGIVHLTGYALAAETEEDNGAADKANETSELNVDDEEDEDDEDWTPSKNKNSEESDDSEESEDEEEDSDIDSETDVKAHPKMENVVKQNQLSETNEDDDTDDAQRKQSKVDVKGKKVKKRKINDLSPAENGVVNGNKMNSKKQRKAEVNHMDAEDSDDDSMSEESEDDEEDDDEEDASEEEASSADDGNEEEIISSVGRTPMPNKRVTSETSLGESPDLFHVQKNLVQKQKTKLKTPDVSSTNKGTIPVTPKNARKLLGGVQVEDLRIGSGPAARNGKFVFVHYIGKLLDGKVFETCQPPKKPFSFRLGKGEVIKGWDIGIEGMKTGGKRKIIIPPNMAYGNQKNDFIPANSTLAFIVELASVA